MSRKPAELPGPLRDLLRLDDGDGPAAPISAAEREALLRSVLDTWQASDAPTAATPLVQRPRKRNRMLWVAAVLLATASAAAFFVARRAPWGDAPPAPGRGPSASATPSKPPAREPSAQAEETAPARVARDLLAAANRLRAAGSYRKAADTYLTAATSAANPQLAQVAQVAAADLELERLDDPRLALALYRAALAAEGPLAPEARDGVARAAQALGFAPAERESLEALRRIHRDSARARWVERRLEALDGE